MKTIAFDVKGTLDGHKGEAVLTMLKYFQCAGWKVVVWSNVISYAIDFTEKNALTGVEVDQKFAKYDVDGEDKYYDICIEDDASQAEWLAAKRVVLVHDIPDNMPANFAKQLIEESK